MLANATDAQAQRVSLALRAGTLGPGVEVTAGLLPQVNVRAGAHQFSYQRQDEFTEDDFRVQGDSDLRLSSAALFVDFVPFKRLLRLTGGLVYNGNHANVLVTPLDAYEIHNKTFSPEKIGTLSARVGHKSAIQPYAGIGLGNTVRAGSSSRISLLLDLGILFTGSPDVQMEGTSMIAPTALQADEIEAHLEGIQFYPVVSLGLSYKILAGR